MKIGSNWNSQSSLMGALIGSTDWKTIWQYKIKQKIHKLYDAASPHVDSYSGDRCTPTHLDICTRTFTAVLLAIAQSVNDPMSTDTRLNKETFKLWHIYTMFCYRAIKMNTPRVQ